MKPRSGEEAINLSVHRLKLDRNQRVNLPDRCAQRFLRVTFVEIRSNDDCCAPPPCDITAAGSSFPGETADLVKLRLGSSVESSVSNIPCYSDHGACAKAPAN